MDSMGTALRGYEKKGRSGGIVPFSSEEMLTARELAADALLKSEERYRMLFRKDSRGSGDHHHGRNGGRLQPRLGAHVRAPLCGRVSREPNSELLSRSRSARALGGRNCVRSALSLNREWELCRKDGSSLWVLLKSVLIDQGSGEPLIQSTMFDITERKRAEDALRRSEESYRNFVAQSSEGIFRQGFGRTDPD